MKKIIKIYFLQSFLPSLLGFGIGITLYAVIFSNEILHEPCYWITQGILFTILNIYYFIEEFNKFEDEGENESKFEEKETNESN